MIEDFLVQGGNVLCSQMRSAVRGHIEVELCGYHPLYLTRCQILATPAGVVWLMDWRLFLRFAENGDLGKLNHCGNLLCPI